MGRSEEGVHRVSVVLGATLSPTHVARLWSLVEGLFDGPPTLVDCDVSAVRRPDARVVEALCRLQLAARRAGSRVLIHGAGEELRDLLELMGLSAAVPCFGSGLEPRGEAEHGEPPRRVEEESDRVDPIA